MSKFTVYAHTRATRQECDDIVEKLIKERAPREQIESWRAVEDLLLSAESALERLDLKEA